MVPVELTLSNFLSYGTFSPPLRFEDFHVACLSGGNGQGKSALLDAVTWALWGEARKAGAAQKPDENLIRTGARRMEVDLTFDLDGARYRVSRSFNRSASGKTSTPGLELQVQDPASDTFRPMTGATVRETQATLTTLLGIDYDTFINSAFLVQGRADEFTKKRPNERKQILSRILNLGKFDQLAELARARERGFADELQRAESDIERLGESVSGGDALETQREALVLAVADRDKRIEELRKDERALADRVAAFEALAEQERQTRRAAATADERLSQLGIDRDKLLRRIDEANVLLRDRVEIERDFELYEGFLRERENLDERAHLFRGVEKQIAARETELQQKRTDWEKRVFTLETDLQSKRKSLNEYIEALAEEPSARRSLQRAREAQKKLAALNETVQKRATLQEELARLEKEIRAAREALSERVKLLDEQNSTSAEALATLPALRERVTVLGERKAGRDRLALEMERVTTEGQMLKERASGTDREISLKGAALREQQELLQLMSTVEGERCPTCGTALTADHRAQVVNGYRADVEQLQKDISVSEAARKRDEKALAQLRERLIDLRAQHAAATREAEELPKIEERIRTLDREADQVKERRAERDRLQAQIESRGYAAELRTQWRADKEQFDGLAFNEEEYEAVHHEAAQISRFADIVRKLEEVAGRREKLALQVTSGERDLAVLRRELDDGTLLSPLQNEVARLKEQLAGIGFDAARLEEVRRRMTALSQAAARFKDLGNAQRNVQDWQDQLVEIEERRAGALSEREGLLARLAALTVQLSGRGETKEALARAAADVKGEEATLQQARDELSRVSLRLDQVRREREMLRQRREDRKVASHQRTVYKHLRDAFGKQGIPSLIIEQTLPELEDRTNELLDRLTDGRMHVAVETLRDTKAGGTRETLDISITDEHGVSRPYETYSGGEAFRVNFALRIALSQLLAERSGVRVRTLFIDEGFGTQDAAGIENMVDAIDEIKDDFDKIVVITHLDEMKEAFPVRIEVEKDPVSGSRFTVFGA